MIATMVLAACLMLVLADGTPLGRSMRRVMVEMPAAALSRIRRGTVLAGAALALTGLLCWWLIGHEGMAMFGMALPELGGALAMVDLGVVADVALVLVAGVAAGGWQMLRVVAARRKARTPRARRSRPARKPAANDDDRPAFALAA
jgi:hypothetical protein